MRYVQASRPRVWACALLTPPHSACLTASCAASGRASHSAILRWKNGPPLTHALWLLYKHKKWGRHVRLRVVDRINGNFQFHYWTFFGTLVFGFGLTINKRSMPSNLLLVCYLCGHARHKFFQKKEIEVNRGNGDRWEVNIREKNYEWSGWK